MAKTSAPKGSIAFLQAGEAGFERAFNKLCTRRVAQEESVEKIVRKIVDDVRENGDSELFALTKKLDGADLDKLEVNKKEWDAACDRVPPPDRAALGKSAMRVREFHRKRIPSSWEMREEGGALMGAQSSTARTRRHLRARRQGELPEHRDHERGAGLRRRSAGNHHGHAAGQERRDSRRSVDGRARRGRAPRVQAGRRAGDCGARVRHPERAARGQDHGAGQRLRAAREEARVRRRRDRQRSRRRPKSS